MSGAVAAAVIVAGATIYTATEQKKAQKKAAKESLEQQKEAQAEATAQYEAQAKASEEAINAAKQQQARPAEAMARAAEPRAASTMLTGPLGVKPEELQLGKRTLLGA